MAKRKRAEKLSTVRRYLIAHTGIPNIQTVGNSSTLNAPWPYGFHVTTIRSNNMFVQQGNQLQISDTLNAVIRYDGAINTVDEALVLTNLNTYARLIHTHYETHKREEE